ncbi:MAG: NTPase [Dehalococcoidia bacterium]|nr:NTPase [Dehalococcoidia bacterium]
MEADDLPKTAILLTGRPGSGKTTIIKKVLAKLSGDVGGFYTEEIREAGIRLGFALVTLTGERAILAHVHLRSQYRVGKYGVDIEALERVGVTALREASRSCKYVVIDEIGKMELYSIAFRQAVVEAIDRGGTVLGTIMSGPHPWAEAIKAHTRVKVVPVSDKNRATLPATLLQELARLELVV